MNCKLTLRTGILWIAAVVSAFAAGRVPLSSQHLPNPHAPAKGRQAALQTEGQKRLGRTPLYFEPNMGQADPSVRYIARGGGFMTLLTANEAYFLNQRTSQPFRLQILGASATSRAVPAEPLPGISNYFLGNDPSKWRSYVPHYGQLRYENIYERIDAVFYSSEGRLEYDFVVQPGGDPSRIQLAWKGVDGVRIDGGGDMIVSTSAGDLRHKKPVVYQMIGGRKVAVAASYVLGPDHHFSIELGRYRGDYALVIDPTLFYSTYLGGGGQEDVTSIVVDNLGAAYISGYTASTNFPITLGAYQQTQANNGDAFVTRISPTGDAMLYSTYVGGEAFDRAAAITIDGSGSAYITGYTGSFAFPTTTGAYQRDFSGLQDAFVARLSPNGAQLVFGTFVGTNDTFEAGNSIAVDSAGNVIIAGTTNSPAFPTTPGVHRTTFAGGTDGFVLKLNSTGKTLIFSTLIGGVTDDVPNAITLDLAANIYIVGSTSSSDFPTTAGAYSRTIAGFADAFLTKMSLDGKRIIFSTFIGSAGDDGGYSISLEPGGRIAIAGQVTGTGFPTTVNAYRTLLGGASDGFVSRFSSDGGALIASTLVGSNATDAAASVYVQEGGAMVVNGTTFSNNFPTTSDAFQFSGSTFGDAFLVALNPLLNSVKFSTVFGGFSGDQSRAMAATTDADVILTGNTNSVDLPLTFNPIQSTNNGQTDGFVARVTGLAAPECLATVSPTITTYDPAGGGGGIAIGDGCNWVAFGTAPWITFTPAASVFGIGAGSLNYSVANNAGAEPRAGAVYAAGNLVPIVQKGTSNTQIFNDVPLSNSFVNHIRIIRNQGVTTGCGANIYCPDENVTRWQMAVFLVRGMIGSDDFPYPTTPYFNDVPATHGQFKWIQKLRELGITTGCSDNLYCPDATVSRGQMAVFLIRARYGNNFTFRQTAYFTDVPANNSFFQYVQKMRQTGITTGCSASTFCANDNITRGQMAVFLTRGFFTPW
ncbi:MAG: SBBP repeat-containing protein [Acidobacteria bacterium]|nr:SBBP repeat-containing protein [Acidobacteriota bacterium]